MSAQKTKRNTTQPILDTIGAASGPRTIILETPNQGEVSKAERDGIKKASELLGGPASKSAERQNSANKLFSPLEGVLELIADQRRYRDEALIATKSPYFGTLTSLRTQYNGLSQHEAVTKKTTSIKSEDAAKHEKEIKSPADLGAFIKVARKSKKLTQQEFADLSGVGRRFVVECEAGKPRLEFAKVLQVAAAAGIDIFAIKR